jgi:hypothetical protein
MDKIPETGAVKECAACGRQTAVYKALPKSIFVSDAEAGYPGHLPDGYAWVCSHCGHEEREPPTGPDAPEFPHGVSHMPH